MFSIISLHKSMAPRFQAHAGKIATISTAISCAALVLIYFMDGPETFLPSSSLLAGYILMGITPLFVFDALRYSLLYRKNVRATRSRPRHRHIPARPGNAPAIATPLHTPPVSSMSTSSTDSIPIQDIEAARKSFLASWNAQTGRRTPKTYAKGIIEIRKFSESLPVIKMTCYVCRPSGPLGSRQYFPFYLGYLENQFKYIPISYNDIEILDYQKNYVSGNFWILKNPQGDNYFIPEVTIWRELPAASSVEYLRNSLLLARENSTSYAYRMLEALFPYAKMIATADQSLYQDIRSLFPHLYPETP